MIDNDMNIYRLAYYSSSIEGTRPQRGNKATAREQQGNKRLKSWFAPLLSREQGRNTLLANFSFIQSHLFQASRGSQFLLAQDPSSHTHFLTSLVSIMAEPQPLNVCMIGDHAAGSFESSCSLLSPPKVLKSMLLSSKQEKVPLPVWS